MDVSKLTEPHSVPDKEVETREEAVKPFVAPDDWPAAKARFEAAEARIAEHDAQIAAHAGVLARVSNFLDGMFRWRG